MSSFQRVLCAGFNGPEDVLLGDSTIFEVLMMQAVIQAMIVVLLECGEDVARRFLSYQHMTLYTPMYNTCTV